ncbi:Fungalysin/Thermolysin Extracellular metalloproteinase 5 [Chytriomyces hyalinus]|nr:Fungalysin/Thermolysin Extracellular metalloproteinase 5 [Chytriomyces hyalinus]
MSTNCHLLLLASLLLQTLPLNALPPEPSAKESMPGYHQPEAKRIDLSLAFPTLAARDADAIDAIAAAAKDALAAALRISKDDLKVSFAHTSTNGGTHHVHFVQLVDGVEISNAVANANFSPDGTAYSVYSSLVPTASSASFGSFASSFGGGREEISVNAAIAKFAVSNGFAAPTELTVRQQGATYVVSGANFTAQDIRAFKKLYGKGGGMIPCWDLSVDLGYTWQNVFVSLSSGEIIAVSDWSSDFRDATYLAVSPFDQAPYNSQLTQLRNPWDINASPYGWHVVNGGERTDTYGNNVAAASNPSGSYSQTNAQLFALPKPTSSSLSFSFQLNNALQAMDATNIKAAVVNMFVASNIAHDFFYNYGFTENAANFQFNNFGRGGLEGDGVIATCQDMFYTDSQSRNNANFMTPAEGQSGRMRMYVFDVTNPTRDGAFDNGVVYHEWGHGLSSRLTGGGRNPNCLSGLLSGGMGEGWSDFSFELSDCEKTQWAVLLTLPNTASRYSEIVIGQYLVGGQGIRRYPYSTNTNTNPYTYSWLSSLNEVHDIGEVWCTIL